ncbi:hypothetical protein [Tenacibaculum sp. 190524A05c]|uniref:hypothetical protein n=1 Tax=Tenacibaculum platacis TaxID=3137852 RepID=UPI0031FB61A2
MKSIKILLVAVLIAFSNTVSANEKNPVEDKVKISVISKQIQKLLANPNFPVEQNFFVKVKLAVNNNNEIVVLSVYSEGNKETIEAFIKSRLNYKKLTSKAEKKVFIVPVKMISL